jgi:hypothetical protein
LRLRAAAALLGAGSVPRTFAARPWTADPQVPNSPDRVEDVSRVAFEAWMPADLKKADGDDVTLAGDAVREAILEPALELKPSLPSVA